MAESQVFHGIAASPGIGLGKVFLLEEEELVILKKNIRKEDLKSEILRVRKAIAKAKKEMEKDKDEMLKILGKSHARLADTYLLILEDPILTKDVEKEITKELVTAEYAIKFTLDKISRSFESLTDEYFKERKNEIVEVGNKILRNLLGKQKRSIAEMTESAIVVAHNLLPSDTIALKAGLVKGFAVDVGGKTSHTALLAQSLEIPAVVGLKNITAQVKSGQTLVVDGSQGHVILDPDRHIADNYRREKEIQVREKHELAKLKNLPAQTLDGKRVELSANLENSEDLKAVISYGAEGVGLFRTEYLFMNRPELPSEDEQYEHYAKTARMMMPYHTLFRTLDVGGDKMAAFMDEPYQEENPIMGLRALRLCLKHPQIFRIQLRALLRASQEGHVRIMFPMVSGIQEFREAKAIFESARLELLRENVPIASKIEVGAMIEVPSAALTSDHIAQEADFLSIGTNDLIQYTLAVDRINENVAPLYEPTHLSILRLIKMTIDAAHSHGKWVGMCGEMASNTDFTRLLLGFGLDEFSVVPGFIPKLKKIIRSTSLSEAKALASEVMSASDNHEVQESLDRVNLSQI